MLSFSSICDDISTQTSFQCICDAKLENIVVNLFIQMNHQNGPKGPGTGFSDTNFFQGQQGNRSMRGGNKPRPNQGQNRPSRHATGSQNNGIGLPSGPRSSNNPANGGKGVVRKPRQPKPQHSAHQQSKNAVVVKPKSTKAKRVESKEKETTGKRKSFESKFMGALLENPSQYGFSQLSHKARPTPKYLLKEQVLFDSSSFVDNQWDLNNQQMLLMRESQFDGDAQVLFEEFQEYRKKEREMMESLNFVDKENAKKSLNDAIVFRGSCKDMCPTYERVERTFKNQVSKWEKDPLTGKISRNFALKTFMRPSGQAPPLPSDVRPPETLQLALNYIIDNLLPNIKECQSFIWDRTRSIRQDFTFQNNYSGYESIDCHEKICRIHILSLHVMAGADDPDYQQQQEIEQFNNSLKTLVNMYDDVKMRGGSCPNEAEFRAYELIVKLKDFELERSIQNLSTKILDDPIVQRALMLRGLINHGIGSLDFYSEFFKTVLDPSKTPFLLACLTEIHFNEIRYNALRSLSKLYHSKAKKTPSVEYITNVLGFDSVESLRRTCNVYKIGMTIDDDGVNRLILQGFNTSFKNTQKQAYTPQIDNMIGSRTMQQIVNSGALNTELKLAQPMPDVEIARQSFKEASYNTKLIDKVLSSSVARNDPSDTTTTLTHNIPMAVESLGKDVVFHSKPVYEDAAVEKKLPQLNKNFDTPIAQLQPTMNKPAKVVPPINNFGKQIQLPNTLDQNTTQQRVTSTSFKFSPAVKETSTTNTSSAPKVEPLDVFTPKTFAPTETKPNQQLQSSKSSTFPFKTSVAINPAMPISIEKATGDDQSKLQSLDIAPKASAALANIPSIEMQRQHATTSSVPTPKKIGEETKLNDASIGRDRTGQNLNVEKATEKLQNDTKIKRQALVSEISTELFDAFMNEQIYLNALEGRARYFADRNLKRAAIKLIRKAAEKCLKKQKLKEEKLEELSDFNNSIVFTNRPINPIQNLVSTKPNSRNNSFSFSAQGLDDQITKTFNKVNAKKDYKLTLVLRDESSPVSKLISNYFNFMLPNQHVSTIVADNDCGLTITKLQDGFDAKKDFKDISMVVLQVGSVPSDEKGLLVQSLRRDKAVISKLTGYMSKYSRFSYFGIVVAYADTFHETLTTKEVINHLGLKNHQGPHIAIGFVDLSDRNSSTVDKRRKLLDQATERVLLKLVDHEASTNYQPKNSASEISQTNNSVITGMSFTELVQPMNKQLLERYASKKHGRIAEIMNATKVKRRRLMTTSSHNTTLDLTNASRINSTSNNSELEELDALADSILKGTQN